MESHEKNPSVPYTRITPEQLKRVLDAECAPNRAGRFRRGSFADRLDQYVRNPAVTSEIAYNQAVDMADAAIALADGSLCAHDRLERARTRLAELEQAGADTTEAITELVKAEHDFTDTYKGRIIIADVRWVAGYLRRYLKLERWATQKMGFEATYWRAGARYQKALAEYRRTVNAVPTRAERARIWDDTALDWARHHDNSRYVRLSDGRSSRAAITGEHDGHLGGRPNPAADGYQHYLDLLTAFRTAIAMEGGCPQDIDPERTTAASVNPHGLDDSQIDPDALRRQGVTADDLKDLTPRNLLDLGIDPDSIRSLIDRDDEPRYYDEPNFVVTVATSIPVLHTLCTDADRRGVDRKTHLTRLLAAIAEHPEPVPQTVETGVLITVVIPWRAARRLAQDADRQHVSRSHYLSARLAMAARTPMKAAA